MKRIFLLLISFMMLFTACKDDKAPEDCIEQTNQFVSYFKEKDFESMYAMTVYQDPYLAGTYDEDSVIGQKLFNAMAENLNFEITGGSKDGKSAYVYAHLITLDFNNLLTNVVNKYMEYCEENAENMDVDQLDSVLEGFLDEEIENAEVFEKDTSIDFIKQNGKWVIEDNVGVYDDLSGGYLTYCFGLNTALGNVGTQQ